MITQACIAGVVSAFENGAAILNRMKQRGAPSLASPIPRVLEESILQAPDEIQRERLRGIVRFGPDFETGDLTAVLALQRITIQLQNSLLGKLRDVEDGDADVLALARAADLGRDNAITTLIALRQRLAQAEQQRSEDRNKPTAVNIPAIQMHPSLSPPHIQPARARLSPPPVPPKNTDRRSNIPIMPLSPATDISRFTYREVEEGQFEIQSTLSSYQGDNDRSSSLYSPYPRRPSTGAGSLPSVSTGVSAQRTDSHESTRQVQSYPLNFILDNSHPSRSNNYLGFCKAAWKLQCGDDKAMTRAKDFTKSANSKYYFLTCSKSRCSFKGRDQNALTNRAITDLARGIRYRWSFLAKSHVFAKSAQDEQYSYLCMFCVFGGHQPMTMNLQALLDHVIQQHRGNGLSEVILHRTSCIQGRICYDNETFDINLLPPEEHRESAPRDSGFVGSPKSGSEKPGVVAELPDKRQTAVNSNVFELYAS